MSKKSRTVGYNPSSRWVGHVRRRVQLHPGTDAWMSGDRYGTVVGVDRLGRAKILMDRSGKVRVVAQGRYEIID